MCKACVRARVESKLARNPLWELAQCDRCQLLQPQDPNQREVLRQSQASRSARFDLPLVGGVSRGHPVGPAAVPFVLLRFWRLNLRMDPSAGPAPGQGEQDGRDRADADAYRAGGATAWSICREALPLLRGLTAPPPVGSRLSVHWDTAPGRLCRDGAAAAGLGAALKAISGGGARSAGEVGLTPSVRDQVFPLDMMPALMGRPLAASYIPPCPACCREGTIGCGMHGHVDIPAGFCRYRHHHDLQDYVDAQKRMDPVLPTGPLRNLGPGVGAVELLEELQEAEQRVAAGPADRPPHQGQQAGPMEEVEEREDGGAVPGEIESFDYGSDGPPPGKPQVSSGLGLREA